MLEFGNLKMPYLDGPDEPDIGGQALAQAQRLELVSGAGVALVPDLAGRAGLVTDTDAFDGLLVMQTDIHYLVLRSGSTWRPVGMPRFADATARDAQLTSPVLGDLVVLTSDEITYRYNGSAWKAWSSDWITWATAPTNLTVGTGGSASTSQRYKWINGKPFFECKYILGTSGFAVGTNPTLNLPIALVLPTPNLPVLVSEGSIYDTSAVATSYMKARLDTTTTVRLNSFTGTMVGITATAPITFAAGDQIAIEFWGVVA